MGAVQAHVISTCRQGPIASCLATLSLWFLSPNVTHAFREAAGAPAIMSESYVTEMGIGRREKRVLILVFSTLFKKSSQKYSTQFLLYFNDCNLVTWPHLLVRAGGECNLGWAHCCPVVLGLCYQVTRETFQSVLLLLSGRITSF